MLKENVLILTCTLASCEFGHCKLVCLWSVCILLPNWGSGSSKVFSWGASQLTWTTWYHSPSRPLPVLFSLWKTFPLALWSTPRYPSGLSLTVSSFLKPTLHFQFWIRHPFFVLPQYHSHPSGSPLLPLPDPQSRTMFFPSIVLIPWCHQLFILPICYLSKQAPRGWGFMCSFVLLWCPH